MNIELISVHIPKTAGTSFSNILSQVYGEKLYLDYDKTYSAIYAFPEKTVIHGHFGADKYVPLFPNAPLITWMREPVAKVVSLYYFWKSIPLTNDDNHKAMLENNLSLLEVAALPGVRNNAALHIQTRKLEDFSFIGLYEYFNEDIVRLSKLLNWEKPLRPEHENKTRYDYKSEFIDPAVLREIRKLNDLDVELYLTVLSRRKKLVTK